MPLWQPSSPTPVSYTHLDVYKRQVQDTAIPGDLATDTGIALANMTLAAWDKGCLLYTSRCV